MGVAQRLYRHRQCLWAVSLETLARVERWRTWAAEMEAGEGEEGSKRDSGASGCSTAAMGKEATQ